jgi:2-(1,2-epoxy-1,2-dihydrophenyl)acetyl-CoA isomerase
MTDQSPPIEFTVDSGVAIAKMSRPKQRNAFTPEFQECFRDIVETCHDRDDIDALILTGTDGVFSAGGDIKGMVERVNQGGASPEFMRKRLYTMHRMLQTFRNMEIPVIAAVDGPAYGGGFGLALCADFILASEQANFCSVFCRIGAIPDYGVLFTLPRMVGMQRAKELMYTGRPVTAEEAKAIGIAMEVYPADTLLDEALALARRMQGGSAIAFGITKRVANQAFDNDAMALIEMEAAGQAICLASDYHKDAVSRFVEKKPLRFNWEAP